tara:strand:+ start:34 stop:1032 length:999 start_codon:yes stop_codon:yes gene_type:complete
MEILFIFLFIVLFNLLIFFKFQTISKKLFLFDKPDGRLKKHSEPVSFIGGLIILINLYLIILILKLFNLDNLIFDSDFIIPFLILASLFYIIGLIDDIKDLAPNLKLLLLFISTIFIIYFFPAINLEQIKISFLGDKYHFKYSSLFLVFCFALLANAINMFDGINLQLILFTFYLFVLFILKGFIPIFFIFLLVPLFFLAILNYNNKVFLGDSGAYLISIIIGCTFIYQYKNFDNYFFGDEVFVILIIPSIDMLRLFVLRLINKKHPFKGDLNHLHHMVDKFTKNKNLTVLITIILSLIPAMLLLLNFKTYIILVISLTIYSILILYLRQKI